MRYATVILFLMIPFQVMEAASEPSPATQPVESALFDKEITLPGGYKTIRNWLNLLAKESGIPWATSIPQSSTNPLLEQKIRLQPFRGLVFQAALIIGQSCELEVCWSEQLLYWVPPQDYPKSLQLAREGKMSLVCDSQSLDPATLLHRKGTLELTDATLSVLIRSLSNEFGIPVASSNKLIDKQQVFSVPSGEYELSELLSRLQSSSSTTGQIQWGILWLDVSKNNNQEKTAPRGQVDTNMEKDREKSPKRT